MSEWSKWKIGFGIFCALVGGAFMGIFGLGTVYSPSYWATGLSIIGLFIFGLGVTLIMRAIQAEMESHFKLEREDRERAAAYEAIAPAPIIPEDIILAIEDMMAHLRKANDLMEQAQDEMVAGSEMAHKVIELVHQFGLQAATTEAERDTLQMRADAYDEAIRTLQIAQRRPPVRQKAPEKVQEPVQDRPLPEAPMPSVVRMEPLMGTKSGNGPFLASTAPYVRPEAYIPPKHRNEVAEKTGLAAVGSVTP